MSLQQRLNEDLKASIKGSDSLKTSVLRMLKAAIKNKEIEKRKELSDEEITSVISTLVKQRRESIEIFSKGGREDLALKESKEVEILQSYLPRQLSSEEVDRIILEAINESSAEGVKDTGKVMRIIIPRIKGAVNGKFVNQRVREILEKR
ncbi:MAG: GatB/YqeY domain-containing protein [Thermodesulfovibrionales bacterium]